MEKEIKINKDVIKTVLAGGAALCLCGMLFWGTNAIVLAKMIDQTEEIATAYTPVENLAALSLTNEETQEEKGTYEIILHENSKTPIEGALTPEEAFELAAGFYQDIFGVNLYNNRVDMIHFTDMQGRPIWQGSVQTEEYLAVFDMDAITGQNTSGNIMYTDRGHEELTMNIEKETEKWANDCDEFLELAYVIGERFFGAEILDARFSNVSVSYYGEVDREALLAGEATQGLGHISVCIQIQDITGNFAIIAFDAITQDVLSIGAVNPDGYHYPGTLG